jgi:glycosyltransferase involved in cell wall biosynthesis
MGAGLRATAVGAYVRFMYRTALKPCRTVFFQNPDDRRTFVDGGLVDQKKALLISGSGVNLDRFASAPVPPGPPVFLLVARLVHEKGIADFAEAARMLKAKFPEARCQVAGYFDGHPRSLSRAQMDRWVADGALEFLGQTEDVRPHLRGCTVYCLPSYGEGTPRTVLEALATGRAVITTDVPGCRETVSDGDNGWLVPVRDPAALADAMERFCREPPLAGRMGRRSRALAEQKFDVHQVNRVILEGMGLGQAEV